jgi:hypothetical protein
VRADRLGDGDCVRLTPRHPWNHGANTAENTPWPNRQSSPR